VAQIVLTDQAFAALDRLAEFLAGSDPAAAFETYELVSEAIAVLKRHPAIGRPAGGILRELVISRGRSGYLALYDYSETEDTVFILGIRHQREEGYQEPGPAP